MGSEVIFSIILVLAFLWILKEAFKTRDTSDRGFEYSYPRTIVGVDLGVDGEPDTTVTLIENELGGILLAGVDFDGDTPMAIPKYNTGVDHGLLYVPPIDSRTPAEIYEDTRTAFSRWRREWNSPTMVAGEGIQIEPIPQRLTTIQNSLMDMLECRENELLHITGPCVKHDCRLHFQHQGDHQPKKEN